MPLNRPHELLQILFISSLLAATFYTATSGVGYSECSTTSNFTTDSTYKSNLNLLLPSLISAALPTNFATLSKGQPPGQVFGLALCFADLKRDECQTCLSAASQGLQQLCPRSKSAAIWPNTCYLRYSNHSLASSSDDDSYRMCFYNPGNVTERFEDMVWELLGNLTKRAAYESTRMFATEEAKFTNSTTVYGLAQCTRDQSENECYRCLQVSARHIHMSECVWGRPGGVVVAYRCYLRFDIYPYYDLSVEVASPEPAVHSSGPPPVADSIIPAIKASGRKHMTMIIFLVIPTVSILIVFSGAIFICFWRRRTFIKLSDAGDEKGNIGSLLFDLGTIRIATNNFCDANKIGRGGFGPVYKMLGTRRETLDLYYLTWAQSELPQITSATQIRLEEAALDQCTRYILLCHLEKPRQLQHQEDPHCVNCHCTILSSRSSLFARILTNRVEYSTVPPSPVNEKA
ncbi:putative Cysteine-rich receptor-like protein kinase 10 [Cocos nucifera]|nr:putative Cysteine-rich receptor-like protein kinase 10 [Cocos nucifera]